MNRKMREQIVDVIGSLNQNGKQNNGSHLLPEEAIFKDEQFKTILENLEETKRQTVTDVEEDVARDKAQKRFEALLGKQLRKVLLESLQNQQTYVAAEAGLGSFFDFAVQCASKQLITKNLILELF